MTTFAIVRGFSDLVRACKEMGFFLSAAWKLQEKDRFGPPLLGIWLHPRMVAWPADEPTLGSRDDSEPQIRVVESTSLAGIWTLCRLQKAGGDGAGISRQQLLDWLTAAGEAHCGVDGVGKFIPVFQQRAPHARVKMEAERLRQRFPEHALPPLFLNPATGHFVHLAPVVREGKDASLSYLVL